MAGESAASDAAGDDGDEAEDAGVAAFPDLLVGASGGGGAAAGVLDWSDSVEIGVVTVAAHVREPCGVWQVNHAKPTTPLQ